MRGAAEAARPLPDVALKHAGEGGAGAVTDRFGDLLDRLLAVGQERAGPFQAPLGDVLQGRGAGQLVEPLGEDK